MEKKMHDSYKYFSKNLKYLRENQKDTKLSQEKLAQEITKMCESGEVTRSSISSYEDGRAEPKMEVLDKIAKFFNISIDQLISIDLSMHDLEKIQIKRNTSEYASGNNLRILTISTGDDGKENIELVPEKASAGYTKGYADEKYLQELPRFRLPFLPSNKTYRAFEVSGDSMLPILPKSIVVGEFVENWLTIKDGDICIVVTRGEGVVLKKVYNRVEQDGVFLLKSTNIVYPPFEVDADDVKEIWRFAQLISKQAPEESASLEEIKNAYWRLEDEVREIKKLIQKDRY
jgi:phage repressor protein C with HTH and peptisase S24 domain